jgi:hypothetical protein
VTCDDSSNQNQLAGDRNLRRGESVMKQIDWSQVMEGGEGEGMWNLFSLF